MTCHTGILSFSRSLSHSSIFFWYFGKYNISNVFSAMSDDTLRDSSHPCYYYFEGVDRTDLVHSHGETDLKKAETILATIKCGRMVINVALLSLLPPS
jgi:hypothetical protein